MATDHRMRSITRTFAALCVVATALPLRAAPEVAADEERPAAVVLPPVEVTGARPLTTDATQEGAAVSGETVRESPRTATLDALAGTTAGMSVSSHGAVHGVASGATGGVSIRGLGGSPNTQVVIVEDDIPDYQGIFGHPIPDAYLPLLLDRAVVAKGGDSVLFGTNAMGGAVLLRSRFRRDDGFEVHADSAYGSFNTLRGSAALLLREGAFDLAGGLTALASDGHRAGAGGHLVVGQTALRYRHGGALRLTLRHKVMHLLGADPGPATHPHPDHTYDAWRNNVSVHLEWSRDRLSLAVRPFVNVGLHRLYDGFRSVDVLTGAIATLDWRVHPTTTLHFGVSGDIVAGTVENVRADDDDDPLPDLPQLGSVALFHQTTFRPWAPLTLVAGLRALGSLRDGFVFLYKAGAHVELGAGFFARARVSRSYRQPTLRELSLPFPTANPDLRSEFALGADVSVGWERAGFAATVTGYRTAATDLIRYFGVWPVAEVVNIDAVTVYGLEASIVYDGPGPLTGGVSAHVQSVGRYTRQNPQAKLNATLSGGHAWGPHAFRATLHAEWVHGLFMANYGREPIPDVVALDLVMSYRYDAQERGITVEPYLHLRNLLDRHDGFVAGYPLPGFHAMVGLRLGL